MKKYMKALITVAALNLMAVSSSLPTYAAEGWKQNQTGWRYEYHDNSYLTSAWLKNNEGSYYFDSTGYMKTGWQEFKGQWYYLQENGAMATNTSIDGCWINENGIWDSSVSGGDKIVVNSRLDWHVIDQLTEDYYLSFSDEINAMLSEVNVIRAQAGAAPLVLDEELSKAAVARSIHMISHGYFSHNYKGEDQHRFVANRYQIPVNGENIAWIQGTYATPDKFVENWQTSSKHYEVMTLTSYTKIGMGFVPNNKNQVYSVQLFAQ